MPKIMIKIKDCSECPHFESKVVYTGDSFERPEEWNCKKKKRTISGYVDIFDKIEVPKWCPVLVKGKKHKKK